MPTSCDVRCVWLRRLCWRRRERAIETVKGVGVLAVPVEQEVVREGAASGVAAANVASTGPVVVVGPSMVTGLRSPAHPHAGPSASRRTIRRPLGRT